MTRNKPTIDDTVTEEGFTFTLPNGEVLTNLPHPIEIDHKECAHYIEDSFSTRQIQNYLKAVKDAVPYETRLRYAQQRYIG